MLWEVRARLVQRLGADAGNKKVLQMVMDGMKISPSSPSMIQERNAIIAAAQANGNGDDVADIWAGFALRGMGFSAANPTGNTVTEAYDLPNVVLADNGFSVAEIIASADGDGFPEPGENVLLTVPIINNSGTTINNVTGGVVGGGNASYGTLINGQTVSRQISYSIPANAACGSLHAVTINVGSDLGAVAAQTRLFRLGAPVSGAATQNFDSAVAPALPANWSQINSGSNTGWITSPTLTSSVPNAAFAPSPASTGEASLITTVFVTSASAQLSFKNFYNTESTWDGMVLEIQFGAGAYQDILTAGGSFASGAYNVTMNSLSPFGTRQTWSGSSGAFVNTVVNLPPAANGQVVNLRWRTASDAADTATGVPGTRIDDVALTGGTFVSGYQCALQPTATPVSISGRVLTPDNKGLTNARVLLTNSAGQTTTVITSSFGNFRFSEVNAGETIVISVQSKRFTFAPQVISITDNISALTFVGQ